MKVIFPTTLDVRFHRYEQGVVWEVLAPFFVIVNPNEADQRIIRVPSGQMTDFASTPRLPFVYLAYGNRAHLPALAHDYLYASGGTEKDRLYADHVFLQGMLDTGEDPHDAGAMYQAVRQFGGRHFKFSTPAGGVPGNTIGGPP